MILGMLGSPVSAQRSDDACASEVVPLLQRAGLDVEKSAPALGCRQDANGRWWMPTVEVLADDDAIAQLNTEGQQLLSAVDRMSMDIAFTKSMRFDRE